MSIGRLFHNVSDVVRLCVSRLKGGVQVVSLIFVLLRYCIETEMLLVSPDARCLMVIRRRWKHELS